MSKNNRVIIFSLTVAVIIAIFLFINIFAILFFYWGDEAAIKDALSTTGSFFGGFATLGTAVVASYLFNDWRYAHNANIKKSLIEKALDSCDLHESNIFESTENISIVKSKLKLDLKHRTGLRYKFIPKNYNNYDSVLSVVSDSHSSFLWGKNIIWKHLMCLQKEKSINDKINIELLINTLSIKSREISNVYLKIIRSDDIQVKINSTDKLNNLLASYIVFMSVDMYIPLSSLRFEVDQSK